MANIPEHLRFKMTYLISKLNKKAYMSFSCMPRIDEKTRYAEIYLKMEGSVQAQMAVFCIDANDNLKYGIRDYYPETFEGKGSGPALYDYFDTYKELVKEWNDRVKKCEDDLDYFADYKKAAALNNALNVMNVRGYIYSTQYPGVAHEVNNAINNALMLMSDSYSSTYENKEFTSSEVEKIRGLFDKELPRIRERLEENIRVRREKYKGLL